MTVSFLSFALIVVFLAIPAFIISAFGLNVASAAIRSVVRMLFFMVAVGTALYFVTEASNALLDVLFALILVVLSATSITMQARLPLNRNFLTVLLGTALPTLVVAALVALAFGSDAGGFSAHAFMIITGMLSCSIIVPCAKSVATYYAGLRNHGQLYYYLLGNGATRSEALSYLHRRALTRAAMPDMRLMAAMFVGTVPFVFWCLALCGMSILAATTLQLLLLVACWCTSIVSTLCILFITRRWGIDQYNRFK